MSRVDVLTPKSNGAKTKRTIRSEHLDTRYRLPAMSSIIPVSCNEAMRLVPFLVSVAIVDGVVRHQVVLVLVPGMLSTQP